MLTDQTDIIQVPTVTFMLVESSTLTAVYISHHASIESDPLTLVQPVHKYNITVPVVPPGGCAGWG